MSGLPASRCPPGEAGDDGWYVDDLRVTQTLGASTPSVTTDTRNNAGLPGCGATCTVVNAFLTAGPTLLPAPGTMVTLSAGGAYDRCVNGVLEFRFWLDLNGNGVLGDDGDTILRDWLDDATAFDAPQQIRSYRYAVEARCSSAPACSGTASATVSVTCPTCFLLNLRFSSKTTLTGFADPGGVELIRGNLAQLRSNGGDFNSTVLTCLADDTTASSATDTVTPVAGSPFYFLARRTQPNNTWSMFTLKELSGAGGTRDQDLDGPPTKAANSCSSPP